MFCFTDESVLRDLKALLLEAKQKVPPFLDQMGLLSDELLELGGMPTVSFCWLWEWFTVHGLAYMCYSVARYMYS